MDQRCAVNASAGRPSSVFGDRRDEGTVVTGDSPSRNVAVGIFVAVLSFCSSSPHFWLNLVTIFSCAISLGMSVSLHSMEKGSSGVSVINSARMLSTLSLVTVVILSVLIGHLVGSSGGAMFLAEFVVTSISLLLGGAGTISASAMESWGCFSILSVTAFLGYLFGRVALMDGIRLKRSGFATFLLSRSVIFLLFFWILVFVVNKWDAPVDIIIQREHKKWDRQQAARKLQ